MKKSVLFISLVLIFVAVSVGQQVWNFNYTGAQQSITLQPGKYRFETWGAQGGDGSRSLQGSNNCPGGLGGYAKGEIILTNSTTVYISVGGQGLVGSTTAVDKPGGWNGGGNSEGYSNDRGGGSGGGATHIATSPGVLSSLSSNQSAVLIVAAGGGGAGPDANDFGGAGGGLTGQDGYIANGGGAGATQSQGGASYRGNRVSQSGSGSFGQGDNALTNSGNGGGGGGWYGGGAGQYNGAGGGSSYLGNLVLSQTISGNTSMPNPSGGTMVGKTGNGYARITELYQVTITETASISCNGSSDGALSAVGEGGTPPYTFAWSTSAITSNISNIPAGTYTVTITDQNSNTTSSSYVLQEPTVLIASSAVNGNVSCNGGSDGSATASATGGTAPYTYAWSNAATTANITGLAAGTYTVTVSDANLCTSTSNVTITEPAGMSVTSAVTSSISCNGLSDGAASVTVSGGASPYTYAWSNAATTANITGLAAGTYTATVTDANNCTATATATVTEPVVPTSSIAATACDSYTWMQNNMMYTLSGVYTDTVQTALGCDSVITLNLTINNSETTADTVTACDSYTWMHNNMQYTTTGVYVDTVQTSLGCDSIVMLDLTIDTLDLTISKFNDSLIANDANASAYQWINCDSNNAIITGATNSSFRPMSDGNYAVILTKGACVDTSACQNVIVNSLIERSMQNSFVIYPNPTRGDIYVEISANAAIGNVIELYNLAGQLIRTYEVNNSKMTVPMGDLEQGLYLIKYGQTIKKVILTR